MTIDTVSISGWVVAFVTAVIDRCDTHLPRPLITVLNVTVHLSRAIVPIIILLTNGPLLWEFVNN